MIASEGAHGWPEAFMRALSRDEILNPAYLFSVFNNGNVYCKACGGFVTENREEHLSFHEQELDEVYGERREQAAQARTEGLKRAREARKTVNETVLEIEESDLGLIADQILGPPSIEHGQDCTCSECKEAF